MNTEKTLRFLKKYIVPKPLFTLLQPFYHRSISFLAPILYKFPARNLQVIVVTGTKGKTSTVEIINAILEEAGYKTAVLGTLRFKIGHDSRRNMYKMSVPGRFFVQKFLKEAVESHCDFAVIEMTSEGAKQWRHKGLDIDTLVFTNLSPEHIESHGSFEKYKNAKLEIAKAVSQSHKRPRTIIANNDDPHGDSFLAYHADIKLPYTIFDIEIKEETETGSIFLYENKEFKTHLPGRFNLYNIIAGLTLARRYQIDTDVAKRAIEKVSSIRGRLERIEEGQPFSMIVDYAHTSDSLEKVYKVFSGARKVCVLGGTGGGRDTTKRAVMGGIAEEHCDYTIITNEDPYDEDPQKIIDDVASGFKHKTPEKILDRRNAISKACTVAQPGDVVIITGKGTDPYIMEAAGKKTPWDDATVCREELAKLGLTK